MSSLIDLRVKSRQEPAKQSSLHTFLSDFVNGRTSAAASLVTEDFTWFGRPTRLDSAEFGVAHERHTWQYDQLRAVDEGVLELLEPDEHPALFGGPLGAEHSVFLVDLIQSGAPVTVGIVLFTKGDDNRVERVFDPAALGRTFQNMAQLFEGVRKPGDPP